MALGRIKARESTKDIKVLDKAAVVSERMKTAMSVPRIRRKT